MAHTPHKFPLQRAPELVNDKRRTRLLPRDAILEQLRPWLEPRGSVAADIGAGPGFFAVAMALRFPDLKVVATDIQPRMLELLKEQARAATIQTHQTYQQGSEKQEIAAWLAKYPDTRTRLLATLNTERLLPLPDAAVDLVLLVDVLHELLEPKALLEEIKRSLKPGGKGVLAVIEWEKRRMLEGPPMHARLAPEEAVRWLHELSGLRVLRELECGKYQWGRLFVIDE